MGKIIFEANCVVCHRGGSNIFEADKTLRQEDIRKYLEGGFSRNAINNKVTNGLHLPPSNPQIGGSHFIDETIADVSEFVYEQAVNKEWDATIPLTPNDS